MEASKKKTRKRKQSGNDQLNDGVQFKKIAFDEDTVNENIDLDKAPLSPANEGPVTCSVVDKRDVATQTEYKAKRKRRGHISSTKQNLLKTVIDIQV